MENCGRSQLIILLKKSSFKITYKYFNLTRFLLIFLITFILGISPSNAQDKADSSSDIRESFLRSACSCISKIDQTNMQTGDVAEEVSKCIDE